MNADKEVVLHAADRALSAADRLGVVRLGLNKEQSGPLVTLYAVERLVQELAGEIGDVANQLEGLTRMVGNVADALDRMGDSS